LGEKEERYPLFQPLRGSQLFQKTEEGQEKGKIVEGGRGGRKTFQEGGRTNPKGDGEVLYPSRVGYCIGEGEKEKNKEKG